jgi:hypothetical protein
MNIPVKAPRPGLTLWMFLPLLLPLLLSACAGFGGASQVQHLFNHEGCRGYRYEYYGWKPTLRCDAPPSGRRIANPGKLTQPIQLLFEHEGCRGYRYEYYGWKPYVLCGGFPRTKQTPRGKLTQPVQLLFEHEGCRVYRFEYYGWHYYAKCGEARSTKVETKLTQPVEFLFEHNGCRSYRFEYYGWHYLTNCTLRVRRSIKGRLTRAVERLFQFAGCSAYRYEYYGWHYYTQCPRTPSAFVTRKIVYQSGKVTSVIERSIQSVMRSFAATPAPRRSTPAAASPPLPDTVPSPSP